MTYLLEVAKSEVIFVMLFSASVLIAAITFIWLGKDHG